MVNIKDMDIEQLVKFVNKELEKNKSLSVNKFCDKYGIKKSTLKSKMSRHHYSYNAQLRKYVKESTADNTNVVLHNAQKKPESSNKGSISNTMENTIEVLQKDVNTTNKNNDNTSSTTPVNIDNLDINKLNILLDNLDVLLGLVKRKNNTGSTTLKSGETKVTSLRINEELYEMVKEKAAKEKSSISDIVNRALLDYLNNYI